MQKSTKLLLLLLFIGLQTAWISPKNTLWVQNATSLTFKHFYIIASEDGDADDEFEDDGTDHCKTSVDENDNPDYVFTPNETMEIQVGKGKYDFMLQDTQGNRYVMADVHYEKNGAGEQENKPLLIQLDKLEKLKK
ncbi:MAG: hypothetical protein ACOVQA_09265 [Thermoflexibacteraceae bacterium]|jgi:hypothetical protein